MTRSFSNSNPISLLGNDFDFFFNRAEAGKELALKFQVMLPLLSEPLSSSTLNPVYIACGLSYLDKSWLEQNIGQLAPSIIKFLVEVSFSHFSEEFILNLFDALLKYPTDQIRLVAFLEGFPVFNPELRDSYSTDLDKINARIDRFFLMKIMHLA
ncbi:MAG: hypothetical protein HWD61_01475 [Parachlamydiaceae bacterium]|nr:MAG: hypothetical protein HWD61_01475 [Parachlamydiaceae bacterium]